MPEQYFKRQLTTPIMRIEMKWHIIWMSVSILGLIYGLIEWEIRKFRRKNEKSKH